MLFSLPERITRIVEAYVGEYASGKSEMAINRAMELRGQGRKVSLVDLDTVEPFYTLRPLKILLEEKGLNIIGFSPDDSFGLGETGAMLNPQARWALRMDGDIILDIGYGVYGARTLNLVEGASESKELKVLAVVNATRPMTDSESAITDYLTSLGRVDAVVSNTHLGDDTTLDVIYRGHELIKRAVAGITLDIAFLAVDCKWRGTLREEDFDVPVKYIERYMPRALW